MEENNYYEDKQNRQFLDKTPEKNKTSGKPKPEKKQKEETPKEKLDRTVKDVGTDVAAGVLGGGLGAAILGSYSFFAGLLVSGFGHYAKNKYIARLGLGIMASSSMKAAQGVKQDPNASMFDNIQERVKAFGLELQRKLLLDKLMAGKKQIATKPDGNLQGVVQDEVEIEAPPAELFEEKDRLGKDTTVQNKIIAANPIFKENKDLDEQADRTFYNDNEDDLTDITDRLY